MSAWGWLRAAITGSRRRSAMPPPGADMLGAATLPGDRAVLPHVVIPHRRESAKSGGNPPQNAASPPAANQPALWRGGLPADAVRLSHLLEGFSATPYLCSAGVWTIGYGSTTDLHGRKVTSLTPQVDEQQATTMALRDLARAADLVARTFPAGLPPRWASVMILMANNMGDPRTWGPTLVSLLREGEWRRAAEQMRHYRNANGRPVLGLRRRRWAEAAYALGMSAREAKARAWDQINTVDHWPPLP